MTYEEALAYLYDQLPMFQRVGARAIKKDLTNTEALLSYCSDPHQSFPSVHVAGTNGKGSVTHMLAAIAIKAGYKVGYYTSPHLKDFRERIRINGQMIPAEKVADFVKRYQEPIEEIQPSFFEVTVTMAFEFFAAEKVEFAVIETGLGGRLDSTNVLLPELSVITNVGLDHQAMLGDTLGEIAGEKAGIIKSGTPVVIGETQSETTEIFNKKAARENAPITYADKQWTCKLKSSNPELEVSVTHAYHQEPVTYTCDLPGYYQASNLVTTLEALHQLNQMSSTNGSRWEFGNDAIHQGFENVQGLTGLRGRWEQLANNPLAICDIAHNPDAIRWHRQQLDHYTYQRLHLVIGLTQEKALNPILKALPTDALYYFCHPDLPRGKPADELQKEAEAYGLEGQSFSSVKSASEAAMDKASNQHDLVLITGSAFVVAEALTYFDQ